MLIERHFGKEFSFRYQDESGKTQKTKPVSTSALLQQVALISGAAGITTYGTMLDAPSIQFTGVMFGIANGMNIKNLAGGTVSEITRAKIQSLKKVIKGGDAGKADNVDMQREWRDAKDIFTKDVMPMTPEAELGAATLKGVAEAVKPIIAELHIPPEKGKGR